MLPSLHGPFLPEAFHLLRGRPFSRFFQARDHFPGQAGRARLTASPPAPLQLATAIWALTWIAGPASGFVPGRRFFTVKRWIAPGWKTRHMLEPP